VEVGNAKNFTIENQPCTMHHLRFAAQKDTFLSQDSPLSMFMS
jgi:hypothetical protein